MKNAVYRMVFRSVNFHEKIYFSSEKKQPLFIDLFEKNILLTQPRRVANAAMPFRHKNYVPLSSHTLSRFHFCECRFFHFHLIVLIESASVVVASQRRADDWSPMRDRNLNPFPYRFPYLRRYFSLRNYLFIFLTSRGFLFSIFGCSLVIYAFLLRSAWCRKII